MKNLTLSVITCLLIISSSCKKEEMLAKLDAKTLTLKVGERHQFVATYGDQLYRVEEFNWSVSDLSIGNVNGSGQFHSGKAGKVTVTATHYKDKNLSLKCEITVVP